MRSPHRMPIAKLQPLTPTRVCAMGMGWAVRCSPRTPAVPHPRRALDLKNCSSRVLADSSPNTLSNSI